MLHAVSGSPSWKRTPSLTLTTRVLPSQWESSMHAPTMLPRSSVRTGSSIVFHVMNSQFNGCGSTT